MKQLKKSRNNNYRINSVLLLSLGIFLRVSLFAQVTDRDWSKFPMDEGHFDQSWESLATYDVPEWFRDAKLGIWAIIGPQCVPMQGDWYARNMYIEGHRQNKYHVEHYGHPSEFGYKDLIELFNPVKLDFDHLVGLYKKAGVPYDGADTNYASLYHNPGPEGRGYPNHPPVQWELQFYNRVKDLIDSYQPDLMYFDGNYPFPHDDGEVGRRLVAHYYNANAKWYIADNQAAMCIKHTQPETCVLDIERGKSKSISKYPWQTDTCIGGWYYRVGIKYKTIADIIRMLIDIVSKNGNLLLNIPLHPNGSIDEQEEAILEGLGQWMSINGSGLYGSRPWVVFGEGPSMTKEKSANRFGGITDVESFEPGDLRFVTKGDNELYTFLMAWPEEGKITIKTLASSNTDKLQIESVTMLGVSEPLDFRQTNKGLVVYLPETTLCQHAWTLCIRGKGLTN